MRDTAICFQSLGAIVRGTISTIIKSYLLSILVGERDIEPIVIKKVGKPASVKFSNVQLLDILNFFGSATNLGSFLKA